MMDGQPLVSVIVPVYNVEDYIDRCLDSIVRQSYSNLEIILIDDGSTDLSGEICDEWQRKDGRIIVVHQNNNGVSSARNTGLELCAGEWIAFVDSDDWIEKCFIEKMLWQALGKNINVVRCDVISDIGESAALEEGMLSAKKYMLSSKYKETIWLYLYKRELFDNIRFPLNCLSEDVAVLYRVLWKAQKLYILPEKLYHSIKRYKSLNYHENKINQCDIDRIKVLKEKAEFFENRGEKEIADVSWRDYLTNILQVYNYECEADGYSHIEKKELKRMFRKHFYKLKKNKAGTWKLKVLLVLSYIYPESWRVLTNNERYKD